ncbi:hypothetical protein [Stenotrophomonas panacihumi]|uniref:hypothetical protein n=1 Tax=Stenotrophomonas panacihumi TaxID=676599 RepID=UPI001F347904|nr:hypothetical protein [Stenotrophomonas panacihumi]
MTPLVKKTLAAVSQRHILQRSKVCDVSVVNTGRFWRIVAPTVLKAAPTVTLAPDFADPLE